MDRLSAGRARLRTAGVKRRWKITLGLGAVAIAAIAAPMAYIEIGCRSPMSGLVQGDYRSLLSESDRRPEARTWLTYPEWHIVYSADSLGRHLAAGRPPSSYPYGTDIAAFWSSFCALNGVTREKGDAGDAKIMIYTIGISYTAELAIKAAYERTIGRFAEWFSGWTSADDRHAARTQQAYGAFMHETPWYRFPFGEALAEEWRTEEADLLFRHWERRFALTAEYGVKAGYASLIDRASGAALGRDALTIRFVARATPQALLAIDSRLKPVRTLPGGLVEVEAPRYAQFSALLAKLAASPVTLVEIAGNDDIFLTAALPRARVSGLGNTGLLLSMPLGERPGWRRIGVSTKVAALLPTMRRIEAAGGTIEHVYDY